MRFARLSVVLGVAAAMGAAACSFGGESTDASNDDLTTGDVSQVLKSTLVLETGCMAVKAGPKQLVLAARCVVGNAAIAEGKSVGFTLASGTAVLASAPKDAGTDAASKDAGAPATLRKITIAAVDVHPSFLSKCTDNACGFDTLAASDAKDIAVLTLTDNLDTITTIPVDLDLVGQSDPLLAVSSGCATFSAKAGTTTTTKTLAVPAKLVNHDGSPYVTSPALVTRLGAGYVVTPAWRTTDEHLCAANIGAPLFRGTQPAVAGITANFTASVMGASPIPVTVHHTRVDISSKVGPWLQDLGIQTIRTCSNDPGGCAKRGYDGGAPKNERVVTSEATTTMPATDAGDAGDAGDASTGLPDQGEETALTPNQSDSDSDSESSSIYSSGSDDGTDGTSTPSTKKSAAASGCSAAPGSSVPAGSFAGLLGVALALGALRRRR